MADYMLDFTGDNLDDGKELQAVDEGEYTLRLVDWKSDDDGKIRLEDKNGMPFIMPIFDIVNCPEEEYARSVMHYLPLPHPDRKKKQNNNAKYHLAAFFKAMGIPYDQPIDPESTLGAEADALLTVTPDEGYGEGNKIKRWVGV